MNRTMKPLCFTTVLVVAFVCAATPHLTAQGAADPAAKTVSLVVDYGDGVEKRFAAMPWREGMTVKDLLDAAAKHPRGIKYTSQGSGASTLLTQIDDLKNGAGDKNWLYEVNARLGDRSFAVRKLEAGDQVRWKFEKYE